MSRIHVFTSAAGNYLPKVKVLFDSLAVHHPEWHRHLLLVEDWPEAQCAAVALDAELHQPRDLDIPDWRPWAFCHSMVELCTAVKPFMLKQLLAREDCDAVVYLDPDICVFSPLPEVADRLQTDSIVLTPHLTAPEPSLEGVLGNELTSLRYGIYNLGFLAVAASEPGAAFARWWAERCYRFCRDAPAQGLFTDQRWIDLVPGLFAGVGVLRTPRLNVAAWNWNHRDIASVDGLYTVSGAPLGFYHFTGFDSGDHQLMLEKYPQKREVIAKLMTSYRDALSEADRLFIDNPWSFGQFNNAAAITDACRHCYRDDPVVQEKYPNPWEEADALIGVAAGFESRTALSVGFVGSPLSLDESKLVQLAVSAAKDPQLALNMARSLGRIVKAEGWHGVRRRLMKERESEK